LDHKVSLPDLVKNLMTDTVDLSLPAFRPELIICATIVVMLVVRIFRLGEKIDPFLLALIGTGIGFYYAWPGGGIAGLGNVERQEIFTGMLVYDSMTVYFRLFLLAFAFWFIILVRLTGLADKHDGQDFYALLLGSTLGMCLMASANHLMTVFLSVEMASVPSYVMAGIIKGRRRASEASLKYAVYGAGAAGVMLYGISLVAGLLGTAQILGDSGVPTIAQKIVAMDIPQVIESGKSLGPVMVLVLGALMIMVGLAFKLSAVPFHFWCPDVFEGASAEVDAFLSVASKAAAMALLVRVAIGVTNTAGPAAPATALEHRIPTRVVAYQQPASEQPAPAQSDEANAAETSPLALVRSFIVQLLAIMAAVTCTFGNLAAFGQTNIKRMLAYSTIAHAGYMIMAVAAAVQLAGYNATGAEDAVAALLFYLAMYVFMNLGAFAIVAFLRNTIGSEEIADYAGLIRRSPLTAVALTVILVSLIGLPPLAGFIGKFYVFYALVDAGGFWMILLLVVAGINTAISLIYYLRVAKVACIDPAPEGRGPISLGVLPAAYVLVMALPVLIYGILPVPVLRVAQEATRQLLM
jgi:NADH-quinone oxidoreductase subunit N